jgi:hypothetical protein
MAVFRGCGIWVWLPPIVLFCASTASGQGPAPETAPPLFPSGSRGFAVVGFKFDTMRDMEDPILFAQKLGVHYPLAVATDDLKQKFGGIVGLPTTVLYDRQGVLRNKVIGFEYTDTIEADVKALLLNSVRGLSGG